jgi:hypothetical protein
MRLEYRGCSRIFAQLLFGKPRALKVAPNHAQLPAYYAYPDYCQSGTLFGSSPRGTIMASPPFALRTSCKSLRIATTC